MGDGSVWRHDSDKHGDSTFRTETLSAEGIRPSGGIRFIPTSSAVADVAEIMWLDVERASSAHDIGVIPVQEHVTRG